MQDEDSLKLRYLQTLADISRTASTFNRKVRLLAVSKYAPDDEISLLAELGQCAFGESRPQILRDRAIKYPDLCWHMIGPLQINKAKYVGRYAGFWHSVEDVATARAVAKQVHDRRLPVTLQINLDGQSHRHGEIPSALPDLYARVKDIHQLKIVGLMGMASRQGSARSCFRQLRCLRDSLSDGSLGELSMGMSHDFHIAIEEGATIVRLGRAIFGPENSSP